MLKPAQSISHVEPRLLPKEGRFSLKYRAQRHSATQLFSEHPIVLLVNGIASTLQDISNSGIACAAPTTPLSITSDIIIEIYQDNTPLLKRNGVIARVQENTIGIAFDDAIDCDALRLQSNLTNFEAFIPLQTIVPDAYKVFCQDLLVFLKHIKTICDNHEQQSNAFDVAHAADTIAQLRTFFMPKWRQMMLQGNTLIAPYKADQQTLTAIKRHTEMLITPEFMGSPGWHRSFMQPQGYPGDYGIMEFIYEETPFGQTLYDKVLHSLGQELGVFVRSRMQAAVTQIERTIAQHQNASVVHITSFGSGSAREIVACLKQRTHSTPVVFHLIDQDAEALSYVEKNVRSLLKKHPQVEIRYYQLKIVEGFRALSSLPKQHLVYSLGVLDYMLASQAKRFVARLFDTLLPNGTLLLANLSRIEDRPEWFFSYVFDWAMIYRTPAEIQELVENLPSSPPLISTDDSGFVHLLQLNRIEG